ncbi:hypothetical protein CEXT_258181 [Caerostris extrusa]|uniref:Uncharacterized protein n=1 Tax=Caerostris extrusa TaxID=172846 RepID=A0AAV4P486_CAEEX|nr:hypothetical protein CEXT_258181 [Caerostris extrusa]
MASVAKREKQDSPLSSVGELEKKRGGKKPPHPSESPQLPLGCGEEPLAGRREGYPIELWIPPLQSPSSLDGHCPPAVLFAGTGRLLRFYYGEIFHARDASCPAGILFCRRNGVT